MKKKFTKTGNSWAMLIPKTIFQLLKVDPETDEVELEFEDDVLKVKKCKEENK